MTPYDTLMSFLERQEEELAKIRHFVEYLAEQESRKPLVLPHERETGFYPRHLTIHSDDK